MCFTAFFFADGLLLLNISLSDLQNMLSICQSEFDWLDMTVNVKKSSCIRIGSRFNVDVENVHIDNKPIVWKTAFRYLGLTIVAAKLLNVIDIIQK